ncbi:myosin-M heavy chain-like [Emydura macquarii macquarii]|uniref:myosin-M heavy chain-like n=1 Tax=Emydura macquarii macquarii TaxID=1129001 RepID=UPI00352AB61F
MGGCGQRASSPVVAKANLHYGCSLDENSKTLRGSLRSKHRWSNVSSLSTDSGIVGVSDERDEADAGGTTRTRSAEVERADSGIGQALARKWKNRASETLTSLQAWEAHRPCTDCGEIDFPVNTDTQNQNKRRAHLCEKCQKRRMERKESILEFVNTEASYGEDLRIIKEEFYLPMQSAGLLTQEQLLVVFSNIQELIDLNENFLEYLQEEIDQAFDQGDEDLMTVCIGEILLEFVNMLPAFQTYCLQQSSSVNMLNALEKEKELLRIFLNVSQNDNTVLRRMNLRSFLMAPLQRVTKYPLLLSRIVKATIEYHPDHGSLREAKSRIESHLEHINMKTRQEGNSWTLRSFRQDSKKNREVINIEMRETAIKTVGWLREETRFVMEGSLQLAQPPDGQWVKKGSKTLKFQNMQVLLMVSIKRVSESSLEATEPGPVKDAVLVLIRDKNNGKFSLLREPLRLSNCVVSADPECSDTFELMEVRREAFVFRDGDRARTHHWFRQIRRYSRELGSWKKRRNALPNIMISTSHNRS